MTCRWSDFLLKNVWAGEMRSWDDVPVSGGRGRGGFLRALDGWASWGKREAGEEGRRKRTGIGNIGMNRVLETTYAMNDLLANVSGFHTRGYLREAS